MAWQYKLPFLYFIALSFLDQILICVKVLYNLEGRISQCLADSLCSRDHKQNACTGKSLVKQQHTKQQACTHNNMVDVFLMLLADVGSAQHGSPPCALLTRLQAIQMYKNTEKNGGLTMLHNTTAVSLA